MMTPEQIAEHAARLAHENSPACRNRPELFGGHGRACIKLAKVIEGAMLKASGQEPTP